MYLTQPPFKHLTTYGRDSRNYSLYLNTVKRDAKYEAGSTLNDFFQQCEDMLRVCECVDFAATVGLFQKFNSYAQLESVERR
jgi:hypothetical protein